MHQIKFLHPHATIPGYKRVFFDGDYHEYEADKRMRLCEEGAKPKRIRYKPISR